MKFIIIDRNTEVIVTFAFGVYINDIILFLINLVPDAFLSFSFSKMFEDISVLVVILTGHTAF